MVLDIGCDENKITPEAIGLDITRALCVDVVASAGCLPFKEGIFDYVVASEVLEHLDDVDSAITEIRRVMQNTGELLATTPRDTLLWHVIWALWSDTFGRRWKNAHRKHFTEDWLLEALNRKMKVVQIQRVNHFLHFYQVKKQER